MNISPDIMNKVFNFSKNFASELRCGNCLSRSTSILSILGSSPMQILPLKNGIKYLTKSHKRATFQFLKVELKK